MAITAGLGSLPGFLRLSRLTRGIARHGPAVALDGSLAIFAYAVALLLRFGGEVPAFYLERFALVAPAIAGVYCLSAIALNLYRRVWRYAGLVDLVDLSASVGLASLFLIALDFVVSPSNRVLPTSVVLLGSAFTHLVFCATRLAVRIRRFVASGLFSRGRIGVVIVGAGQAGQLLAREMIRNREWDYQPVCFVDDDPASQGLRIHGVPVRGRSTDIPRVVAAYDAKVVAIAIPAAPAGRLRAVVDICQPVNARLLYVPGIGEVLSGASPAFALRELRIEDLLGREPVSVDLAACRAYVAGRAVLVTGAAGSIGSELCRQVLRLGPSRLMLYDNNESGVHDLGLELRIQAPSVEIVPCVGSVADEAKVRRVFGLFGPKVVFHAAAYKHVPLMEEFPEEAVEVNVLGTRAVASAAEAIGVERFVLISTDKAVRPSNVMGATKRLSELVILDLAEGSSTVFCVVRFGNVLGSRGSVVPLFSRQIEQGGPITITHPDVRRYFMTIPEAVSLVIQAGSLATPGDVFVLEMGEQVRILDLAEKMARFRGLTLGTDIAVVYTGLRPGEKLAEELVGDREDVLETSHPKIRRLIARGRPGAAAVALRELRVPLATGDRERLRDLLLELASDDLAERGRSIALTVADRILTRSGAS